MIVFFHRIFLTNQNEWLNKVIDDSNVSPIKSVQKKLLKLTQDQEEMELN